jgi:hypothetical protein
MRFIRRLHLKRGSAIEDIAVVVFGPIESNGNWICRYEIGWPEGVRSDEIGGADALQAIYLCLQAVALTLYASPHHKAGRLYWGRPGQGYGFPMPKAGLGDLVGEDKVSQV